MEAARHLRAVDGPNHTAIAKDIRSGDLIVLDPSTGEPVAKAQDTITGLLKTIETQGRTIGSLERAIRDEGDVEAAPNGREIRTLFERWKSGLGKTKPILTSDRVKAVRALMRAGYEYEQMELAVDGLLSHPFLVYGDPRRTGGSGQRHDEFKSAFKGGAELERYANLGYQARRQGWSADGGWPE